MRCTARECGGRCLREWLDKHVAAARHQAVLASADCINDIAAADDEADITETLGLDSWPPLARPAAALKTPPAKLQAAPAAAPALAMAARAGAAAGAPRSTL